MNHARQFQVINWDTAKAKLKAREYALLNPPEWLTRADICSAIELAAPPAIDCKRRASYPNPVITLANIAQGGMFTKLIEY